MSGSESHRMQQMSSSSSSSHSSSTKTTSTKKASSSSVMTAKKSTMKTSSSTTSGGASTIHEDSSFTSMESSTKQDPISFQDTSSVRSLQSSTQQGLGTLKDSSSFSFNQRSTLESKSSNRDDLTDVKSIMRSSFDDLEFDNPVSLLKDSNLASMGEGTSSVYVKKSTQEGPGAFSQSTVTTKRSSSQQGLTSMVMEESTATTIRNSSSQQGLPSIKDVTILPTLPSLEATGESANAKFTSYEENTSHSAIKNSSRDTDASANEDVNIIKVPVVENTASTSESLNTSSLKSDSSTMAVKESITESFKLNESSVSTRNSTQNQENVIPVQQPSASLNTCSSLLPEESSEPTLLQETSSMSSKTFAVPTSTATVSTRTEEPASLAPGLSVEVPITVTRPATWPGELRAQMH